MKLPIKLTWEDDEWVFRDADDVRIGGMDAMMDLVGDLVVQRDALVKVCELAKRQMDALLEAPDFPGLSTERARLSVAQEVLGSALALAKGENATA